MRFFNAKEVAVAESGDEAGDLARVGRRRHPFPDRSGGSSAAIRSWAPPGPLR